MTGPRNRQGGYESGAQAPERRALFDLRRNLGQFTYTQSDEPQPASEGQTWYDTDTGVAYIFQNGSWVAYANQGWREIAIIETPGMAYTVPIPGSPRFIRGQWQMVNSAAVNMGVRVNADSTAGLHIRSTSLISPAGTYSTVNDGTTGNLWWLCPLLANLVTFGEFTIDCQAGSLLFAGTAWRPGVPTGSQRFESWGWLAADRTLTSLQFTTASTILLEMLIEGYYS